MVLKNKIRSDEEYEETRRLNKKVKENTRKAEAARIDLETQIKQIQEERKRWALRDAVPPRHINFDSTAKKKKPMATPKDNMLKAHKLLAKGNNVDLNYLREIVGTDRKSTRLNSSHLKLSRMPSSA